MIIGLDEVGRGPWAGPIVACAVSLDEPIEGLKDSKKLSPKKREKFAKIIHDRAKGIGFGWVSADMIDKIGLSAATKKAFALAYVELGLKSDEIIIDGNINFLEGEPGSRAVIKADDKYPAVMAASIVAKVARDNFMVEMSERYPDYGFENHKGYGTAEHSRALREFGVCQLHRKSFKPVAKLL